MNDKARATFASHGDLIGRNLMDCHNERSVAIIKELLATGGVNCYTIDKKGVKKIDIARQKGGISSREQYTLERFEVVRHT